VFITQTVMKVVVGIA